MKKITLFLSLLPFANLIYGQVKPPLAVDDVKAGLDPSEEIRLFDLNEIKTRRIDTAYIIYHPASWLEYDSLIHPCSCTYNDTLTRFIFDNEGRIVERTSFQLLGDYSSTLHYDTLGNLTAITRFRRYGYRAGNSIMKLNDPFDSTKFKQIIHRQKTGKDSLITTITLWKFNYGFDTAFIEKKIYNSLGDLLEIWNSVNKRKAREIDDENSSNYHYKYEYDNRGRLIYYRDFSLPEYELISYPFYGKLVEIYNASTHKLQKRQMKVIKVENGIISITLDQKQIILSPLEKNSKLFKLRSIIESGPFPLLYYHEIVYKQKSNN
jgi:hypothetical protein